MPKYRVPIYFVCSVEVEAESESEARDIAGCDEQEFNVEANFLHQPGGPAVDFMNVGMPILIEENPNA